LSIAGQWQEIDCPNRPPPTGAFTFVEIDPDHALLFGGRVEETRMNHVYILDMRSMVSIYHVILPLQPTYWGVCRATIGNLLL